MYTSMHLLCLLACFHAKVHLIWNLCLFTTWKLDEVQTQKNHIYNHYKVDVVLTQLVLVCVVEVGFILQACLDYVTQQSLRFYFSFSHLCGEAPCFM